MLLCVKALEGLWRQKGTLKPCCNLNLVFQEKKKQCAGECPEDNNVNILERQRQSSDGETWKLLCIHRSMRVAELTAENQVSSLMTWVMHVTCDLFFIGQCTQASLSTSVLAGAIHWALAACGGAPANKKNSKPPNVSQFLYFKSNSCCIAFRFLSVAGHCRGHSLCVPDWKGTVEGTLSCFLYWKGIFIMFCQLYRHHRGHFITLIH